jgi:hypothetical protein
MRALGGLGWVAPGGGGAAGGPIVARPPEANPYHLTNSYHLNFGTAVISVLRPVRRDGLDEAGRTEYYSYR